MGASMGPVLANIIMTELEKEVVDRLVQQGKLKFYSRYVDNTLMMLKPEDVDSVLEEFNRYHPSLQFTVDRFQNEIPHFLDLEIHRRVSQYTERTRTRHNTPTSTRLQDGRIRQPGSGPWSTEQRSFVPHQSSRTRWRKSEPLLPTTDFRGG